MNPALDSTRRNPGRALFAFTVIASVACLISAAGCAGFQKSKASRESGPQVTALASGFEALKQQFNSEPSKPRLLALFSPTCGGCIYGAKALQAEAQKFPEIGERAEVMIVWVAMLPSDNEREARKAAQRFDFPGVHHFYDRETRVGARLMAEQFPNAVRDALEILPPDDVMRARLEQQPDLPPEKVPLWDALLVFPPGVKWEHRSPAPSWWTKQTRFSGERKTGELTAVFWKNSTRQLPIRSDWHLEAREALRVTQRFTQNGEKR